jgi:hypothetical protein
VNVGHRVPMSPPRCGRSNGAAVSADAVATNLGAMESLWRVGIAAEILLLLCATALTAILYVLLRPVNRGLAVAATCSGS